MGGEVGRSTFWLLERSSNTNDSEEAEEDGRTATHGDGMKVVVSNFFRLDFCSAEIKWTLH